MTTITTTQLQEIQRAGLLLRTTDEEAPIHAIGKPLTDLVTLNILIINIALRLETVLEPFHRPWLRDEHLIQALERSLRETC